MANHRSLRAMRKQFRLKLMLNGRIFTVVIAMAAFQSGIVLADSNTGHWRERTQLFWNSEHQRLVRQTVKLWVDQPYNDLEFVWDPDRQVNAVSDGPITGTGTLIWRAKGTPSYDLSGVHSKYSGQLKNGKRDGFGHILYSDGAAYLGSWSNGLMNGHGQLKFANGDEYQGQFVAGIMQGQGRYASVSGEVFIGKFINGAKHGIGQSTLPNGLRYQSEWRSDVETKASRLKRIKQFSANSFPKNLVVAAQDNEINVAVVTDRKATRKYQQTYGGVIYDHKIKRGVVKIVPSNKGLYSTWKGNSGLENGNFYYSDPISPVYLAMQIENGSGRAIDISGIELRFSKGDADLQPAVSMGMTGLDCSGGYGHYDPSVELISQGWSSPNDARIIYAFADKHGKNKSNTFKTAIPKLSKRSNAISVETSLRKLRVKTKTLKNSVFECKSREIISQCAKKVLEKRIFGKLQKLVWRDANGLLVNMVGRLEYKWKDNNGNNHNRKSPFKIPMVLAALRDGSAECADLPVDSELTKESKPIEFKLSRKPYRLSFPVTKKLRPTEFERYTFRVFSRKSSLHFFHAVVRLRDGRMIKSIPVELNYFRTKH